MNVIDQAFGHQRIINSPHQLSRSIDWIASTNAAISSPKRASNGGSVHCVIARSIVLTAIPKPSLANPRDLRHDFTGNWRSRHFCLGTSSNKTGLSKLV